MIENNNSKHREQINEKAVETPESNQEAIVRTQQVEHSSDITTGDIDTIEPEYLDDLDFINPDLAKNPEDKLLLKAHPKAAKLYELAYKWQVTTLDFRQAENEANFQFKHLTSSIPYLAECSHEDDVEEYVLELCNGSHSIATDIKRAVRNNIPNVHLDSIGKTEARNMRKAERAKQLSIFATADNDVARAKVLLDNIQGDIVFLPEIKHWYEWGSDQWRNAQETGLPDYLIHQAIGSITKEIEHEVSRIAINLEKTDPNTESKIQSTRLAILEKKHKHYKQAAKHWGNMRSRSSIIEALKREPGMSVSAERFDDNPQFALCKNGYIISMINDADAHVLDPIADYEKEDYIRNLYLTQSLGAEYIPEALCPIWDNFLNQVLPDAAEQRYLQQAIGYTLYGEVTEKTFFFLYGTGDNGKSVFTNTMSKLFGELGKNSNKSLFVRNGGVSSSDGNVLAGLKGKRFVINDTEIAPDDRLNENCIKTISGNDGKLTARRAYEKEISFTPHCTLWMFGNHKPKLSAAMDKATLKRIKLLKFDQSIPKDQQDKQLTSKLENELSGILNWVIEGYNDWRKNGFIEPQSVQANVDEYAEENDTLGGFLEECVELTGAESDKVCTVAMFAVYKHWCEGENHKSIGRKNIFTRRMKQRGDLKQSSTKNWCEMKIKAEVIASMKEKEQRNNFNRY